MFWITDENPAPWAHAAFRGHLEVTEETTCEIRTCGASWFRVWLDGEDIAEGPLRYETAFPQHDTATVTLKPGKHVIAIHGHYRNVPHHRTQKDIQPFLWIEAVAEGKPLNITWRCAPLPGYHKVRQIDPILGWMDWVDTAANPEGWQGPAFDDAQWQPVKPVTREVGAIMPATIAPVKCIEHAIQPVAQGAFAEQFGHGNENWEFRFFTRDLECRHFPAQGIWRRYDLGPVYLGRPRFVLDLPAGAVVEAGYGEFLVHDRVTPYILGGNACNMDHWVARGGIQEFTALEPRGGRYMELHIMGVTEDQVQFIEEAYIERTYHTKADGAFSCDDPLLNRIWEVGVETYRSCAEDALTDNPTRERGQWTGDVVNVGMDIGSVAFHDTRILRRALVQAAQSAGDDGLVAAMSAGFPCYIGSFSAQWTRACLRYEQLTGDHTILEELYEYAKRNMQVFLNGSSDKGVVVADTFFNFVDWGYEKPDAETDMALNLFAMDAFRAMGTWCRRVGKENEAAPYDEAAAQVAKVVTAWLESITYDPAQARYHAAALCLRYSIVPEEHRKAFVEFVKAHILNCFPNNPDAPRHYSPEFKETQLITPYFAHFVLPVLIENGEIEFVLEQMCSCWGWMLNEGLNTWAEVFDLRWSHCHVWSGCPTWVLSRYALGLHPQYDEAADRFVLELVPGSIGEASGCLPMPNAAHSIHVAWQKTDDRIRYVVNTENPATIICPVQGTDEPREVVVDGEMILELNAQGRLQA